MSKEEENIQRLQETAKTWYDRFSTEEKVLFMRFLNCELGMKEYIHEMSKIRNQHE